jgi:hypothetical protein
MLVALAIVCLWLRWAPHGGYDRKTQLVALTLLILILFPIISVTDDLLAAQNPAETDSCVRRDYAIAGVQPAPQITAFLAAPLLVAHRFGFLGFAGHDVHPLPVLSAPATAPIENRPPPIA